MQKKCINCHFLAKKVMKQGFAEIEPVTNADREKLLANHCELEGVESFHCYMKVWDERTDPGVRKHREENLLEKDRSDRCFHMVYKPNLSFETAQLMSKRKEEVSRIEPFALLGERAWLIWIISGLVLTAAIFYHKFN